MRCCQIPCVSAESLKACALIGLLLLAAEGKAESMAVNLLIWEICGGTQNALTGTATLKQCEHNVESLALNAVRQDQSGERFSLFLEDWELARVALSCHFALDVLRQEMHEAW